MGDFGAIDNVDFKELPSEKYWSFPKGYKKDSKVETQNMIFSKEYLGARKIDGAYYRFIKDMEGNMRLQGRNRGVSGEFLNKIGHVPHLQPFFDCLPNGTCLLGELYFPNKEGSSNVTTIMGCLEQKAIDRQKTGEKLHYYIFDVWALNGKSLMKTKFEDRVEVLQMMEERRFTKCAISKEEPYEKFAHYYEGKELWGRLQLALANGYEGAVITRKDALPEPGKRTARKTLKIKKELQETLDVVVLDKNAPTRLYNGKEIETWKLWENVRTGEKLNGEFYKDYQNGAPIEPVTKTYFNGWAGSLVIGAKKGNKLIPIGSLSGLADEVLQNWERYKGKIAEITCMEVFPSKNGVPGGLRHPKFLNWREDLTINDTDYYRIFNE
jgi:hypothetical protein